MSLRITIGIATWNRCDLLAQTLESLTKLRMAADVTWEVLVCDNNSTDQTRAVVEAMHGKLPVRYLFEPTQGKSHALNRIVAESSGDWLLMLDDDVLVEPGWAQAYVGAIRAHSGAGFMVGPIEPWLTFSPGRRARFLLEHFPWINGVKRFDKDERCDGSPDKLPHGANMALSRRAIGEVGYDTSRGMFAGQRIGGEDTLLGLALMQRGYEGWLVKEAVVRHYTPRERLTFRWYWKWNENIGAARCRQEGPARRGRTGYLWVWRIVAKRFVKAAWLAILDRRRAYEVIGDAAQWLGYMKASRAMVEK